MNAVGLETSTQVAVTEMGMRGPGQIRALAEVARPDIALITAIAPVHLELLGSMENVVRANAAHIAATTQLLVVIAIAVLLAIALGILIARVSCSRSITVIFVLLSIVSVSLL